MNRTTCPSHSWVEKDWSLTRPSTHAGKNFEHTLLSNTNFIATLYFSLHRGWVNDGVDRVKRWGQRRRNWGPLVSACAHSWVDAPLSSSISVVPYDARHHASRRWVAVTCQGPWATMMVGMKNKRKWPSPLFYLLPRLDLPPSLASRCRGYIR
jgi:hypothetical protein